MIKKYLLIIICISMVVYLTGCTLFRQSDSIVENNSTDANTLDMAESSNIKPENDGEPDTLIDGSTDSEYPVLLMRFNVNIGMEESYDVVELTDQTVTYSYYDYSDAKNPVLKEKTVPFEEMLVKEKGEDKYYISLHLFDGTNEYEMEMTRDLENKIRNYPEFRRILGTMLGKHFVSEPKINVISSGDIKDTSKTGSKGSNSSGDNADNDDSTDDDINDEDTDDSDNSNIGADNSSNDGEVGGDDDNTGNSNGIKGGNGIGNSDVQQDLQDGYAYQVSESNYSQVEGKLKCDINYPQVSGLSNGNILKTINGNIKNEALKVLKYYDDPDGWLESAEVNIKHVITMRSPAVLSIQYYGLGEISNAPHPHNLFYTTNINIRTGEVIRLKDIVKIDEAFARSFISGKFKAENDFQAEALELLDIESILSSFREADRMDNIGTVGHSYVFSYFTEDSLGISIPVPHTIGDHAEFEIKYQDITDNILSENEIWKELFGTDLVVLKTLGSIRFETCGQVKLTAGKYDDDGIMRLKLLLSNEAGNVVCELSELTDIPWFFENLAAIEFLDADADGFKDIIVIAEYITGVGPDGMIPFPVAIIYFQRDGEFVRDTELEQKLNESETFTTAEDIVRLVEKYLAE